MYHRKRCLGVVSACVVGEWEWVKVETVRVRGSGVTKRDSVRVRSIASECRDRVRMRIIERLWVKAETECKWLTVYAPHCVATLTISGKGWHCCHLFLAHTNPLPLLLPPQLPSIIYLSSLIPPPPHHCLYPSPTFFLHRYVCWLWPWYPERRNRKQIGTQWVI